MFDLHAKIKLKRLATCNHMSCKVNTEITERIQRIAGRCCEFSHQDNVFFILFMIC